MRRSGERGERVLADAAPALLGFFLRRIDVPEDAADLVSETLASAWKARRRMPAAPEAARMWCFGVARNVLLHHHRGRRRRDALVERLREAIAVAPPPACSEDALAVREAVAALAPELGELVRLVHWDGFTVAEAAELLGINASTARSQPARAKVLLRDALAEPAPSSRVRDGGSCPRRSAISHSGAATRDRSHAPENTSRRMRRTPIRRSAAVSEATIAGGPDT